MSEDLRGRPSAAGWHQDPADPTVARYWNGFAWTAIRRWNGTGWVDQPAPPAPPAGPTPFPGPSVPVPAKRSGSNPMLLVGGIGIAVVVIALLIFGFVGNDDGDSTDDASFRAALMAECGTDPEFPTDACECVIDRMLDEFSQEELIEMGLDNPEGDLGAMSPEDRNRLLDAAMPCVNEG